MATEMARGSFPSWGKQYAGKTYHQRHFILLSRPRAGLRRLPRVIIQYRHLFLEAAANLVTLSLHFSNIKISMGNQSGSDPPKLGSQISLYIYVQLPNYCDAKTRRRDSRCSIPQKKGKRQTSILLFRRWFSFVERCTKADIHLFSGEYSPDNK